jgi:hypothetical protein
VRLQHDCRLLVGRPEDVSARWRRAIVLVAVAASVTCSRGATPVPLSIDIAAERYVRIVLALAERDADSLDSYHGPQSWQAEARARHAPLDAVRAHAVALRDALSSRAPITSGDDEVRRAFLIRQLDAVVARIDIVRGSRPSFAAEARGLFGLNVDDDAHASADVSSSRAAVRAELNRLLPGRGELTSRYAAFDSHFRVAPAQLPQVVSRALAACRAATAAHVLLPEGERIEIAYVPQLAWSAFTRYQGAFVSRIEINSSLALTVDRLVDLACHEGYPGHHAINALVDARFGGRRTELLVQPLYSPQTLLHEAAASIAPSLAFGDEQRIELERELFRLAGLDPADVPRYVRVARLVDRLHGVEADITRRYLDGYLDFPRASGALEREALMPSADATLKFINRFRTYAATYTIGRDRLDTIVGGRWPAYVNAITDGTQTLPTATAAR